LGHDIKKLKGFNIFEPMGYDAFGLPAENSAIQTGIHPQDSTLKNINDIREQLNKIGCMYDWNSELMTCDPKYYKWNQWLFLQLYKKGLAYRKKAPVNWCPKDQTVLANEQVQSGGTCERCGTTVIQKNLSQWFFKITDYAEELLDGLDKINWPDKTKLMQRNWIGKSVGAEVTFLINGCDEEIKVFTTRPDTLFGATYMVLAPEHPLIDKLTTEKQKQQVNDYKESTKSLTEIERTSTAKEKTGVSTGAFVIPEKIVNFVHKSVCSRNTFIIPITAHFVGTHKHQIQSKYIRAVVYSKLIGIYNKTRYVVRCNLHGFST